LSASRRRSYSPSRALILAQAPQVVAGNFAEAKKRAAGRHPLAGHPLPVAARPEENLADREIADSL
jgi:hypothetical protein